MRSAGCRANAHRYPSPGSGPGAYLEPRRCASVVPEALSAPAFEHVDDATGPSVHHCSYKLHFIAADPAGSVGVVLDNAHSLRAKYFHEAYPLSQGDPGGNYNSVAARKLEEMGCEVATNLRLYTGHIVMCDLYDPFDPTVQISGLM